MSGKDNPQIYLDDIDRCYFPELLNYIYNECKVKNRQLDKIDHQYGDKLCRLLSRRKQQYQFLDWLKFAGEALVIKAQEKTGTRHTVAIKVASPQFALDPDITKAERKSFELRFLRGMIYQKDITYQVHFKHGSIPQVYEVSEKPLYFVMQYIDGVTLDKWVLRASLADRMALFEEFIKFLYELHTYGFVHRDLKPNNIIVRLNKPNLIDLTTAKMVEDQEDITVFQVGFGCRGYASPEVLRDIRLSDHRSDIYSAGKIMEFIYTQKFPYDGRGLPSGLKSVYIKATQQGKSSRYKFMSAFITAYLDAVSQLDIKDVNAVDIEGLLKDFRYKAIAIPLYKAMVAIAEAQLKGE